MSRESMFRTPDSNGQESSVSQEGIYSLNGKQRVLGFPKLRTELELLSISGKDIFSKGNGTICL